MSKPPTIGTQRKPPRRTILLAMATFGAATAAVAAVEESAAFVVDWYGGTNECSGSDVSGASSMESAWSWGLGAHSGDWPDEEAYFNDGVDSSDFLGSTSNSDPTGIDSADVALFVGNGTRDSCTAAFLRMGDNGGTCSVSIEAIRMDTDLNMAILWASNSVHECVVGVEDPPPDPCVSVTPGTGTTYSQIPLTGAFEIFNGFHGDTWVQWSDHSAIPPFHSDMRNYVAASEYNGWGENFINYFTEVPSGADNDRCPSSAVYASTMPEFISVWEAGGFKDRNKLANYTNCTGFVAPAGCDPADGATIQ